MEDSGYVRDNLRLYGSDFVACVQHSAFESLSNRFRAPSVRCTTKKALLDVAQLAPTPQTVHAVRVVANLIAAPLQFAPHKGKS
jgi:hypothetical protein